MARSWHEHVLFVDDLEVWVVEKAVRRITLHVMAPDARIEVTVPRGHGVTDADVTGFVRKHRRWLDRRMQETLRSPMAQAENATPEQVREWRAVVEACVPPLVAAWEPILGVKAQSLVYRNMKTRWGSCQPGTGRICINVRLALYPPECLEYVVVHELCHLLVAGHGPDFHALMTKVMPDWKQRRAKLR